MLHRKFSSVSYNYWIYNKASSGSCLGIIWTVVLQLKFMRTWNQTEDSRLKPSRNRNHPVIKEALQLLLPFPLYLDYSLLNRSLLWWQLATVRETCSEVLKKHGQRVFADLPFQHVNICASLWVQLLASLYIT